MAFLALGPPGAERDIEPIATDSTMVTAAIAAEGCSPIRISEQFVVVAQRDAPASTDRPDPSITLQIIIRAGAVRAIAEDGTPLR